MIIRDIFSLILLKNVCCDGSDEGSHHMFLMRKKRKYNQILPLEECLFPFFFCFHKHKVGDPSLRKILTRWFLRGQQHLVSYKTNNNFSKNNHKLILIHVCNLQNFFSPFFFFGISSRFFFYVCFSTLGG